MHAVMPACAASNSASRQIYTKILRPNRRTQTHLRPAFIYNPTVHGKRLQATHAATCKHFFACGAAQPRRVQSHACFVLEGGTTAFICIYTFLKFVLPQTSATSSCAKILCFGVPDKFRISSGFCGVFSYTKKPPEVSKSGKNLVSSPSIAEVNPTKNTS